MAAQQRQKIKGNPASTRMGNVALKARRARSWERGQMRKAVRREAQAVREATNRARGVTAWQVACQRRAERRRQAA